MSTSQIPHRSTARQPCSHVAARVLPEASKVRPQQALSLLLEFTLWLCVCVCVRVCVCVWAWRCVKAGSGKTVTIKATSTSSKGRRTSLTISHRRRPSNPAVATLPSPQRSPHESPGRTPSSDAAQRLLHEARAMRDSPLYHRVQQQVQQAQHHKRHGIRGHPEATPKMRAADFLETRPHEGASPVGFTATASTRGRGDDYTDDAGAQPSAGAVASHGRSDRAHKAAPPSPVSGVLKRPSSARSVVSGSGRRKKRVGRAKVTFAFPPAGEALPPRPQPPQQDAGHGDAGSSDASTGGGGGGAGGHSRNGSLDPLPPARRAPGKVQLEPLAQAPTLSQGTAAAAPVRGVGVAPLGSGDAPKLPSGDAASAHEPQSPAAGTPQDDAVSDGEDTAVVLPSSPYTGPELLAMPGDQKPGATKVKLRKKFLFPQQEEPAVRTSHHTRSAPVVWCHWLVCMPHHPISPCDVACVCVCLRVRAWLAEPWSVRGDRTLGAEALATMEGQPT